MVYVLPDPAQHKMDFELVSIAFLAGRRQLNATDVHGAVLKPSTTPNHPFCPTLPSYPQLSSTPPVTV